MNALPPVVLLIALGCIAGRAKLISHSGVKNLSNLVFMVVLPALLFRTMVQARPQAVSAASLFAQTGLALPDVIDRPMQLIGQCFSPLALILVGLTLAQGATLTRLPAALWLSTAKNLPCIYVFAAIPGGSRAGNCERSGIDGAGAALCSVGDVAGADSLK